MTKDEGANGFEWRKLNLENYRFLRSLTTLCSSSKVEALLPRACPEDFDRLEADGLFTCRAWLHGKPVGLVQCDFRVNGGSFGHDNSRRLSAFVDAMGSQGAPIFFMVNSIGVRIMEGRTVFSDAFSIWPALARFKKSNLLVTCAAGKCLGLGALLFGLGDYRLAVAGETRINLTGPEVMKLFFGDRFSFEEFASAERQTEMTDLIHELSPNREAALRRGRQLLELVNPVLDVPTGCESMSEMPGPPPHRDQLRMRMDAMLKEVSETRMELFPELSPVVKVFVASRSGKKFGLFINPPGNPNNMITIETLQKYSAGLAVFKALKLPVLSMLDSPGADPRLEQSDRNNIRMMIEVGEQIIFYPYGSMGIVIGRCYGGATTLCFPKVFGARKSLVLEGAQLGVMHSSIIRRLFDSAPRLLDDWERVYASETANVKDLIEQGTIDAYIGASEMGREVLGFLSDLESSRIIVPADRAPDRRTRQLLAAIELERRVIERRRLPRFAS